MRSESAQGEEIRKAYWRPKVSVLQTRHSKSLRDMVDSFDSIEEARNQFAFEITHIIHEVRPEGEKPNEKT